jgi:arylsulfatase A-like enzyme
MDSARADFIKNITPIDNKYLDLSKFMSDSVKFNNAYTPLARSFPALYSLLSGNYPKTDNIRFNLVDQSKINYKNLLPHILKDNGYETFYATDSSQFHIINKKWGYNVLAAPKPGIYEQIFPVINDLPLSNLIISFAISEYLFPYDYSNAAAHNTYEPKTYVKRIINKLQTLNNKKPLFLHFNFEVAHWPYFNRNINKNLSIQERYTLCLNILNSQINEVFKYLTDQNILNNSIVVMTSDHGEALNITNDKLTNYNNYIGPKEYLSYINKSPVDYTFAELNKLNITNSNILSALLNINTSGGHGVDVLSNSQYKTLTAIQKFQTTSIYPKQEINNLVLLNDLYPTILDLLNIQNPKSADHLSLVKLFDYKFADNLDKNDQTKFADRNIFLETELQVPYYKPQELANKDIIASFINTWGEYYHINKSQYLELKANAVTKLLQTKQYAVVNNNNVLAYIPNGLKSDWDIVTYDQLQKPSCMVPRVIKDTDNNILGTLCNNYKESNGYYVYYNAQQNNWQIFPNTALFENKPEIYKLYTSLKANYQNEILPLG